MCNQKQIHLASSTKFNLCRTRLLVIGFNSHRQPMTDQWLPTMTDWWMLSMMMQEGFFSKTRMQDGTPLWVTTRRAGEEILFGSFYCKLLPSCSLHIAHAACQSWSSQPLNEGAMTWMWEYELAYPTTTSRWCVFGVEGVKQTTTRLCWWFQLHLQCRVLQL